jgi:hypothetical protein
LSRLTDQLCVRHQHHGIRWVDLVPGHGSAQLGHDRLP